MEYLVLLLLCVILVFLNFILIRMKKQEVDINPLNELLRERLQDLERVLRDEMILSRRESKENSLADRQELGQSLKMFQEKYTLDIDRMIFSQKEKLSEMIETLNVMQKAMNDNLEKNRETVEKKLSDLQRDNNEKLEKMRETVDEKLQSTLQKRIGESFSLVREQLDKVQRGLGEMQNLANDVGGLKRVLSNVKDRGTWGEVQLGAILEQMLSPEQYQQNVQVRGHGETVEYAIKLPGKDEDNSVIWLPVDAKFPQESYLKILDASERGEKLEVEKATAELIKAVEKSAKDIHEKYIDPPHTTDFAIMFLPTEGLYSEVLRVAGMMENLQQKYRVVIAGPTTLSAILTSLRMGFRTMAIEKRAGEVWKVLAAVKTEFGKFGEVLDNLKRQVQTVANTIDKSQTRTKAMSRTLRKLDQLPAEESEDILGLEE
ncbi:MAG: DNA recombination protein RmuC [Candidatus Cloacimonetes bacterium]|nr:DNA recombination protein RmuC [Candidatus Cloacimonadota bacterium]